VVAFGIVLVLLVVNLAVDPYDEPILRAHEIDNIGADRMLPAKLLAVQSMTPKHRPESLLTRSRPTTEIPRRFTPPEPPGRTTPVFRKYATPPRSRTSALA